MMLMQILLHTPRWVFGLFAVLLALGLSQVATRRASLTRVSILPLVMLALSFIGVWSGFAASQPWVLLGWVKALGVSAWLVSRRPAPAGTEYDAAARTFALPGSFVPLAMMMAIFFTKYAVGIALAMQPGLAHHTTFAWVTSVMYGAFSGVFLGRALRLWRMAMPIGTAGTTLNFAVR